MSDFANRFKELRLKAGLTQDQLSENLGISRSTIGMYETGKREPDFETLEKIVDYFNVDMNYLIGTSEAITRLAASYYIDPATAAMAQEISENPELHMLFSALKDSSPEDLKLVADMVKRFKGID